MIEFLPELEDSAAVRFYNELEAERLMTTRCKECDHTFIPPRVVCPQCLGNNLEWIRLSGRGTLYAFSQQYYAMTHRQPEVVGTVELDEGVGRVFTLIDAPFEELQIGMPVEASFFKSQFGMTLHKFKPVYST